MKLRIKTAWVLAAAAVVAVSPSSANTDQVSAQIKKIDPTLEVQQLQPSPVAGLYRVSLSGVEGYVTADGKHFIVGDMFDVATRENLVEVQRRAQRLSILTKTKVEQAITFAPSVTTDWVIVFTDVDCGYCRKLHAEIDQFNKLGIGVRYLAYPRSGPGSDSWSKMESVWCSKDQKDALTRAKRGDTVNSVACENAAVAQHYKLGESLGVVGTPSIYLADGTGIPGYVPPQELAAQIKRMKAGTAAAR